jgi:hypothetical protein
LRVERKEQSHEQQWEETTEGERAHARGAAQIQPPHQKPGEDPPHGLDEGQVKAEDRRQKTEGRK